MRNFFIFTHRWIALIAGLVVAVTSVTGAAIAYEQQIDRVTNARLFRAPGTGAPLPLDTLLARVRAAVPGTDIGAVQPAQVAGQATVFGAGRSEIFVDPATGKVLGRRTSAERNAGLARRLHVLHTQLMAGPVGNQVVYWVTVLALYLIVTGIVIWWPDKIWKIQTGASWKRINFDLHHVLGIFTSLVLIVVTGTGVMMSTRPLNQFMLKTAGETPRPRVQQAADSGKATISIESAAAAARAKLPGAAVMSVDLPGKATDPFEVSMRYPDDRTPGGRSLVIVDRYRGSVLASVNSREVRAGTRLLNLERPLHTGDIFGTPTLIIWILSSLVLALQGFTGFLMWWNARPARKAAAARAAHPSQVAGV